MIPSYNIPSMERMRDTLDKKIFLEIENQLRRDLDEASSMSVILDLFSSQSMDGYLAISVSYVKPNFQTETALLDCVSFKGRHTAVNIYNEYENIVEKFNIKHKVLSIHFRITFSY